MIVVKLFQKYKFSFSKEEYSSEEGIRRKYVRLIRFNRLLLFQLVTLVHVVWGFCLIFDPESHTHSLNLEDVLSPLPIRITGALLLLSAIAASTAIYKKFKNVAWRAAALIPQQFFLTLSAIYALTQMQERAFVGMGKLALVSIAIAHSISLFYNFIFLPIKFNGRKKKEE